MAITERYVEAIADWVNATAYTTTPLSLVKGSDGSGYYCILAHTSETGVKGRPTDGTAWDTYWAICDGTATKPWTLTQAFATAVAGDRVNIKSGTYSRAADDSVTNSGSSASPLVFRGYYSTIGDLSTQGRVSVQQALDTTNFPAITYAATKKLAILYYTILESLKITVAGAGVSGAVITTSGHNIIRNCYVENPSTNAAAYCANMGSDSVVTNSDIIESGATGAAGALYFNAANTRAICCRVKSTAGYGISAYGSGCFVYGCVIYECGTNGISMANTNVAYVFTAIGNTIVNCGGNGINIGNAAYTSLMCFINNHVTGCTGSAFNNGYSATANLGVCLSNNRTRGNGTVQVGFDDWATATSWGHVTSGSADSEDYTDATTDDYTLITTAVGKAVGMLPYTDIGGLQRQEPAAGGGGQRILGGSIVR